MKLPRRQFTLNSKNFFKCLCLLNENFKSLKIRHKKIFVQELKDMYAKVAYHNIMSNNEKLEIKMCSAVKLVIHVTNSYVAKKK